MASPQPLLVTGSVREYEMQPAYAPQITVTSTARPVDAPTDAAPQAALAELQISVPSGCQAGQTLQFTPPGYVQPLSVVMQQQVLPGSVVTVQYPVQQQGSTPIATPNTGLPGVSPQRHAVQQGALPPAYFNAAEEDGRASIWIWVLYAAGCVCLCFIPFCGCAFWVVAAGLFYCKPAEQRAQLPRSRLPALTALITCIAGSCCFMAFTIAIVVVIMSCGTIDDKGLLNTDKCDFDKYGFSTPPPYHPFDPTAWPTYFPDGPSYPTFPPHMNSEDHSEDLLFTTIYDQTTGVSEASKMPPVPHAGFEVKTTDDTVHV